ncbi:MAG TPA: hypothetical protein VKB69_01835 [Micromonosporaceae bacterium]|nr:hypothetical protein [Micromonosporaceae bacterium]
MTAPERRANVASHLQRLTRTLGRATPGPIAVRACVAAAGLAGVAAGSGPDATRAGGIVGLAVLVLMPALLPRGMWPSIAITAIIGWYLLETSAQGHIDAWRPIVVAACVYGVHTGSALAAVLPYDAVVGQRVLGPWALRAAAVTVLTSVLAVFVLTLPRLLGDRHLLGATIGGLAVLAATAMYLVYLGARGYGDSARALLRRIIGAGAGRSRPGGPGGSGGGHHGHRAR